MDTGSAPVEEHRVAEPGVSRPGEHIGLDGAGDIQGKPALDGVDDLRPSPVHVVDDLDPHPILHAGHHQGGPQGEIVPVSGHPVHGLVGVEQKLPALLRRVGQEAHHGPAEALRPPITGGRFYGRQCRGFCRQSLARSEGVQRTQEPLGQLRVGVFRGFVKPLGHRGPVQGPGGDAAQGLKLLL